MTRRLKLRLKVYELTRFVLVFFSLSGSFYNLPSVSDFIIDVLLGSPSAEVLNIVLLCNCECVCTS